MVGVLPSLAAILHLAPCPLPYRPLSKAQLEYAQRDAHYLLYIAHKLYQELQAADAANPNSMGQSKVMQAWERCQKVSLNLYTKHTSQV